jgi:hypothetical protein
MTRAELHTLLLDIGTLLDAVRNGEHQTVTFAEMERLVRARLESACLHLADVWPESSPPDEYGNFS